MSLPDFLSQYGTEAQCESALEKVRWRDGFRCPQCGHDHCQACLRPRDRFWDIPVPKIDSAFDNLFVPQPSWSPSTTQQLRKLVAAPYLAPNDWTPRSEAYFVFPLAQGTPGKQCGLAATGVYQPSLRSPWLAATVFCRGQQPLYQCSACHHQTSLQVGTLFQASKLPLTTWFL
ncbi:transposase, partial [Thiolapillus sp.]|uniref:transposase n=1 Tax=Thiolapillus sp. TaxID=2017437 RepID=UPI003AF54AB4